MSAKDLLALSSTLDDVELRTVTPSSPLNRTLEKDPCYTETYVPTNHGQVLVAQAGDRSKPALVTYHDLGLNYISNYQAFFNYPELRDVLDHFCIFHLNAPGQEEGALLLPDSFEFPTMEVLAEQVLDVINHFSIVKFVGIGVGLGANILIRHALLYPERVNSLMLVNACTTKSGWIEWGYQKRNIGQLRTYGITQPVLDYLIWHHFGQDYQERPHDLLSMYKHYWQKDVQCRNLAMLVEQYIWRTDIAMDREAKTLAVPVLNLVGGLSPHVEDTVVTNGRLDPPKTSWIKIMDAAMVLEEQPGKVCQAFRLFLQGQGYCLKIRKLSAE